jgi:hypothetical protein
MGEVLSLLMPWVATRVIRTLSLLMLWVATRATPTLSLLMHWRATRAIRTFYVILPWLVLHLVAILVDGTGDFFADVSEGDFEFGGLGHPVFADI